MTNSINRDHGIAVISDRQEQLLITFQLVTINLTFISADYRLKKKLRCRSLRALTVAPNIVYGNAAAKAVPFTVVAKMTL